MKAQGPLRSAVAGCLLAAWGCTTAVPAPATAPPADIAGVWEVVITAPRRERTVTLEITQEDRTINVTMTGESGGALVGSGTLSGTRIQWTVTRQIDGEESVMAFVGTVTGDTMSGTVILPRRELPWTATRAPDGEGIQY